MYKWILKAVVLPAIWAIRGLFGKNKILFYQVGQVYTFKAMSGSATLNVNGKSVKISTSTDGTAGDIM